MRSYLHTVIVIPPFYRLQAGPWRDGTGYRVSMLSLLFVIAVFFSLGIEVGI